MKNSEVIELSDKELLERIEYRKGDAGAHETEPCRISTG